MAKILLIDDEPDLLAAMAEILTSACHDVTPVSDGRLVLNEFTGKEFDLVITDIIMPGVEGLEILKHLGCQNSNIKAIAISGGGRIEPSFHLRLAEQLGAKETLKKPFRLKELSDAVDRVLQDQAESKAEAIEGSADQPEFEQSDEGLPESADPTASTL